MMETDQNNVSNASKGTVNVGENPSVIVDVSMEGSLDNEAKEHGLLNPKTDNIYRQDVVMRNDGSLIGVVTEVAGDSDSDSESDITDDDDGLLYSDEDKEEQEGEGEGMDGREKDGNAENKRDDKDENGSVSESSDDRERGPLVADHVRILWMDDSETTHHRNDVTVVDRGFLHGDYVASAGDPTGQVGLVVDVNMTVDLLAPDGSIVKDVSTREVKRVRDITVGDYVVSGPWLGRVDDVLDQVTILFDDGSVCKIQGAEPLRLRPIAKNLLEDNHCPYHPGQRVKASSSSVFKDGQWLLGKWKANRGLEGTVIKVTVGSVYVHWIASSGYGPFSSVSPAEEQSSKNLKLLSCFSHANWQLGDWCFLPSLALSVSIPLDKGTSKLRLQEKFKSEESIQDVEFMGHDGVDSSDGSDVNALCNLSPQSSSCNSSLSVSKDNVQESWHIHRKKLRKVVVKREKKPRKKEENFERALMIVNTRTKVDIGWQDGTLEQGLDSTLLIPIESPGDHDFVAEQYVIEKAVDDNEETSETRRVGVIKSVDAKEKTACVNWLKQVARSEDPLEFEIEEIVSVYELEGHPDYDYCYGDVVVRLSPAVAVATTEKVRSDSSETNCVKNDTIKDSDDKQGAPHVEVSRELADLSWVGNITGLKNGDIEVTWADGMVSTVGPQAVYVVGRDDDDESIVGGISEAASWETQEGDEMDVDNSEKEQTSEGTENNSEAREETAVRGTNSGINGPLGLAFEFMRMASEIFSCGIIRDHEDSESFKDHESVSEKDIYISEERASVNVSDSHDPNVTGGGDTSSDKMEVSTEVEYVEVLHEAETLCSLRTNESDIEVNFGSNACRFKRFDTAKDPLDHIFLGANIPGNNERKWLKKVQRDWSILQNNLPDGIYVRVFEDRMDLLRAVIVGAFGTPYQDGLFFFDFHMPPEYPDVPPSAHYHSGGWRINPNLYEEGKVCLSLLNTWTGRGNEVWDPQSSSILQILVSLQGLVLNSKPYFNEAGYDKQIGTAEGEKNSLSYNENTFLLNCKTIMYLMRKPPKDFEDLVKEHFKQRGYYILKACDAYMNGYLIGTLTKDAMISNKSQANATSAGFKLMLAKIVPKLISSLNNVGVNCQDFEHLKVS